MKRLYGTIFGLALALLILPRGADAVTISPPYFDYSLNPGDTVLDVIKVYNEDPYPITLYPQLMNFTATEGEEGGTPSFYPAGEDPYGTALAPWITVDTDEPFTIQPNERANIPFAINVPKDGAQPGGHFGAVVLSTTPPEQKGGEVGIGQQIASLILVRVSGEVREIGAIAEFGFADKQVWYNYLPVDFFLRFENSGNTHLRPAGNLFIKNWYGRQVAAIKVNPEFGGVLPNSIRRFTFGWKHIVNPDGTSDLWREWHNFALGKYTATLVVNYGSTNQILSDVRTFYVWPWRLMLIFGAVIAIVLILFWVLKAMYDRAVIKKYEMEMKRKSK
jgi:hypothetical protein